MTPPDTSLDDHTRQFEQHRSRLFGVAYRMLGSRADAEDVLQDCYLRWRRSEPAALQSAEAWLMTVTTRLSLDRLRAAQNERARYVGPWLPEPLVEDVHPSPEHQMEIASELSVAFLAVLERLGPEERAVFLLRDVFDYDYPEIAEILGKAEPACRQMLHRARLRVREDRPRFSMAAEARENLLRRFFVAASSGNRDAVMALLADDARYVSDGGGKVVAALKVLVGPDRIGRLMHCVARNYRGMTYRLIRVNGELGAVSVLDGHIQSILAFETADGRITGIYVMRNPDKITGISLDAL
ncbi:MAG: RNA polymerase sigma-70 factor [Burkholderiales bacterium]|nr:RNA polymerase sigma-70 factor [Burkholderiales bacterium]